MILMYIFKRASQGRDFTYGNVNYNHWTSLRILVARVLKLPRNMRTLLPIKVLPRQKSLIPRLNVNRHLPLPPSVTVFDKLFNWATRPCESCFQFLSFSQELYYIVFSLSSCLSSSYMTILSRLELGIFLYWEQLVSTSPVLVSYWFQYKTVSYKHNMIIWI